MTVLYWIGQQISSFRFDIENPYILRFNNEDSRLDSVVQEQENKGIRIVLNSETSMNGSRMSRCMGHPGRRCFSSTSS
ncbi:hypothetical protein V1477_002258 [Vespula maculifrons]|uniref:Uncharacterized protein n=1 Tax=Vespula maculifrons TaxID=7453 RepID=A0ABD2CW03_VESMC